MKTQTTESTPMNVKEVNNSKSSEELVKRESVKDSPFTIISLEDKEHFGVMGEYRVTETMNSKGEVEDELRRITWNRIIQVIMVLDEIKAKDKTFKQAIEKQLKNKKKN